MKSILNWLVASVVGQSVLLCMYVGLSVCPCLYVGPLVHMLPSLKNLIRTLETYCAFRSIPAELCRFVVLNVPVS